MGPTPPVVRAAHTEPGRRPLRSRGAAGKGEGATPVRTRPVRGGTSPPRGQGGEVTGPPRRLTPSSTHTCPLTPRSHSCGSPESSETETREFATTPNQKRRPTRHRGAGTQTRLVPTSKCHCAWRGHALHPPKVRMTRRDTPRGRLGSGVQGGRPRRSRGCGGGGGGRECRRGAGAGPAGLRGRSAFGPPQGPLGCVQLPRLTGAWTLPLELTVQGAGDRKRGGTEAEKPGEAAPRPSGHMDATGAQKIAQLLPCDAPRPPSGRVWSPPQHGTHGDGGGGSESAPASRGQGAVRPRAPTPGVGDPWASDLC